MTDPRYKVVFGAWLTQFTVIGLLFSYGLLFKIFETEFGWSRTLLSACTSLAFLMMGVLAIFSGRLNDRYGPRAVLGVAGTLYGLGFALISQVSEPWHLFAIFGLLLGVGLSTHDVVTLSTVARWFQRRRGVMTGVVKVGTAAGQVAIPPLAALLIARPAVAGRRGCNEITTEDRRANTTSTRG
jgi:MFS family permease